MKKIFIKWLQHLFCRHTNCSIIKSIFIPPKDVIKYFKNSKITLSQVLDNLDAMEYGVIGITWQCNLCNKKIKKCITLRKNNEQ